MIRKAKNIWINISCRSFMTYGKINLNHDPRHVACATIVKLLDQRPIIGCLW